MQKEKYTPEKLKEYKAALNSALDIGEGILKNSGTSLDAVEKTINFLENSPLFNAGKGAVLTHKGKSSLDASIMVGTNRNAGAVGGVSIVKNPISAARAVMEKSDHVMLAGRGADDFAKKQGLEIVEPSYFLTEKSKNRLEKAIEKEKAAKSKVDKYGTVGCVALDRNGNIVAGTSTGGMNNKKWDRIGDSPIIGAGTYADNKTCGVSATGHGEYFIRNTVARDIAAMMEYGGSSLEKSADYIINDVLVKAGGDGGIVALDKSGNIVMPFNTSGMYRGYRKPGERVVKIFKD
ncbi:UNVERIFIED_CONTAM: hypothetical protein GTU68_029710 [Idotea baltica]|nr:hypothetical protein [Idotea baltica]